jgi:tRNA (guanine10-N2)-dimethyltransferase
MILFRLSREHPTLPALEIRALYETYGKGFEAQQYENLLLVRECLEPKILQRLSLTREFFRIYKVADKENLDRVLRDLPYKNIRSFCVCASGFESDRAMEKELGAMLKGAWELPVDLTKPSFTVSVINLGERIAVSTEKYTIDKKGLEDRHPNNRPYFHPAALDPKLARLFLNLARAKERDTIVDPFCGSGSILIEASLMEMDAIGLDRDLEMIWGCQRNLDFYTTKAKAIEGDARRIEESVERVDAIVTDPPYARSSRVYGKGLRELYSDFLKSSNKVLKPGGYVVFSIPSNIDIGRPIRDARLKLIGDYEIYVHKSLTRRVYILRRPN